MAHPTQQHTMLLAVLLFGCGPGQRNVSACEAFVSTQQCGAFDFAQSFPCEPYAEQRCDLGEWFACLEEHTTCSSDPAGGPVVDTAPCAAYACG